MSKASNQEREAERACSECQAPIPVGSPRKVVCSDPCALLRQQKQIRENTRKRSEQAKANKGRKLCAICGLVYTPKHSGQKYCSKDCAKKGLEAAIERQRQRRQQVISERNNATNK